MMLFAQNNAIIFASDALYMSAKQLQHCMRASKASKGLVVDDADLIGFPLQRFQMDLYYDANASSTLTECRNSSFILTTK